MNAFTELDAARLAKVLGDPTRLRIYAEIASWRELYVGELQACRILSNATVSHHLRILTQAGLIAPRRSGQHVFYRRIPARMIAYRRYLAKVGKLQSS